MKQLLFLFFCLCLRCRRLDIGQHLILNLMSQRLLALRAIYKSLRIPCSVTYVICVVIDLAATVLTPAMECRIVLCGSRYGIRIYNSRILFPVNIYNRLLRCCRRNRCSRLLWCGRRSRCRCRCRCRRCCRRCRCGRLLWCCSRCCRSGCRCCNRCGGLLRCRRSSRNN